MQKRRGDIEKLYESLTKNTQKVIMEFLKYYEGQSSYNQYLTTIVNMFLFLGKKDVKNLTVNDYSKIIDHYKKDKRTSQDSYRDSFFRYIYCFEKIENPDGFTFNKEEWTNRFKSQLNRKLNKSKESKKEEKYEPALTFPELEKVIDLINIECDETNIETLKFSFICYMLYYTNCAVDDLRVNVRGANYVEGKILLIMGEEYRIPDKYKPLFDHLKTLKQDGFSSLDRLVDKIGKNLNIVNLRPNIVKNAREQNMLRCSLCGNKYFNTIENWIAVNNKIVCTSCSEELKKKQFNKIGSVKKYNIEHTSISDNLDLAKNIYTFDELKKKLANKIDYKKLHEFQMYIGQLGERYVYDNERLRLRSTKYEELVDISPSSRPGEGYDILSFDKNGDEIYIEVKTEAGYGNDFYLTETEFKTAKRLIMEGKNYVIYRVHNILAKNKEEIKVETIGDIFDNEKYQFKPYVWKISMVK